MNASQLLEDGVESAKRAVQFDANGQRDAASYFYGIAAKLLEQAATVVQPREKATALIQKSSEYRSRGEDLKHGYQHEAISARDDDRQRLKRYKFMVQQALDADVAGFKETAIELYTNAIEFATQHPELLQGDLKDLTMQALERAEILKGIKSEPTHSPMSPTSIGESRIVSKRQAPLKMGPQLHRGTSVHLQVTSNTAGYTNEEKRVLFHTSKINNIEYLPFMDIDLSEKFQYAIPFTDKDGKLKLSANQTKNFHKWVRPDELAADPCIFLSAPDYYAIKQTCVTDCSVIASLAVSASYERKFGRKLITAIIYPRNRDKQPVYNPFGKYMVKLHLNGVTRKVIIDDYLPMDKYGQLLCSYSSNKNEFWVSLLEKAYMKTMGGYDFPGSNSNIDLHALTGWIPERVAIRPKDTDFNRDALFKMLEVRLIKGDVLVTVATGELSTSEEERTGLVSTHAYAVMDIKEVHGVRLIKLKNPWSHVRWRGNYSEMDRRHWTPELKQTLNYDPDSAQQFDNGVFWIDYDSVCAFYDVLYMNWNPELFTHTYSTHEEWNAGAGPAKDAYTIGSNPQYSLELEPDATGAVWVLLTRHLMDIEDFRINKEYITLVVYKGSGKRIYYPNEPEPYIDGVRINSLHYLCKIIISPGGSRKYTLVVSQYEKTSTIYYTLRAYATSPFKLTKIIDPFTQKRDVTGEWKGLTAGGCSNHPQTFKSNPRFRIDLTSVVNNNHLLIELKGPREYQMGLDVTISSINDESITAPFKTTSSGPFRSGFVVLDLDNIPSGVLHVVPSTFLPDQEGPFILTVKSSATIQITRER